MANTFKALFRGAASTSDTTLYTVPADTTTLINNIAVTNTSASAFTYNILLDDVLLSASASVPANDTVIIDLKQVLTATKTVKGKSSSTAVNFHISGLEID
jgi:hypothetical protein